MSRVGIALAAIVVAASLAACEPEEDPVGDVQVTYRVGSGSQTCEDVGIHSIRVYLMTSATNSERDETFACDPEDQNVMLEDVPEGDYTIRVEGLDRDAQPIYTGESAEEVEVNGNETNGPFTVILDQLRPSMLVWFGFSEVGGCDRFEVQDIRIVVYENGASSAYDETVDCIEATTGDGLLIEGLSESATYDVRIRGANDNDEYTYEYNEDGVEVAAGAPTEVSAELASCSGVCTDP